MFFFLLFLSITALSQLVHEHSKPVPSFRIIHGRVAGLHSHPYQVGIYVTGKIQSQFCGGSLVSNNYVLTAAHCVEDVNALSMELIFGAHNVTDKSEETQVRRISTEFTVHPGTLAGWGITSNTQNTVTPLLHEVNMTIMSNADCAAVSPSYKAFIKPSLLCTSGLESGVKVGFCKGDSGGPLVVGKGPDSWLQVGVVSFGQSDCEKGLPSVFERVAKYVDWVKANSDVVV
ncbi:unnamed protein product [Acanthoscelides obtectus]|uniref:Peptidase S1 domain-containing protein n=1 Tax=Acanthoscelides obtectus TaxID=200917 RepID=A0A9P0LJH0_ACAOB|nr:unnamed protein product [Acanthoscelides obtectus]CAK1660820.1 hypothetical protein AOBTE_LOCUS22278 [Acanthoscelides obtectus]